LRILRRIGKVERLENRARDDGRVVDRRELGHPRAVPELGREPPRELDREPRLADAADPGQRDEPDVVAPAELGERRELALAAEERRRRRRDGLGGPAARRRVERGVVREDRLLELAQRLAGLDPELVDERAAGA